jgi:hypothetical protein
MGSWVHQLLATICVILSLTLFALGNADPVGEFCIRTLSYSRPMTIMEPILDTVIISRVVVGTSCEELRRRVNMGLLRLVRAHHFASSVVTQWGYKAGGRPCTHLCPLAQTLVASSPLSLRLKIQKDRYRNRVKFWGLESATSPSLSNHGGAGLDPFRNHTGAPAGPHKPGVHDGGRVRNLSCA